MSCFWIMVIKSLSNINFRETSAKREENNQPNKKKSNMTVWHFEGTLLRIVFWKVIVNPAVGNIV